MQQITQDRRDNKAFSFPLVDCDGNKVTYERRSGKDRRNKSRDSAIAREIINIVSTN